MTVDRHSEAEQKDLIDDPVERARQEVRNGVIQFDMVLDIVRNHVGIAKAEHFRLKPGTILRLQDAALKGIHPLAGTYRNSPVHISGSKHAPPAPFEVAEEVHNMCSYVNDNWQSRSALHLAAYILWKLNWIHPFADGNGRTARAVSYLVMSIKLDSVLPGTPTIPEQIAADKGPYYDALEAADIALQGGDINVSALESMLEAMLVRQLTGMPSFSSAAEKQLLRVIDLRVKKTPPSISKMVFGSSEPAYQMWMVGDHFVLQVGSQEEIAEAAQRQQELGTPFPLLIGISGRPSRLKIDQSKSGEIYSRQELSTSDEAYFELERDCGIAMDQVAFDWKDGLEQGRWALNGAIYIVRLSSHAKQENIHSVVDALIARHISLKQIS